MQCTVMSKQQPHQAWYYHQGTSYKTYARAHGASVSYSLVADSEIHPSASLTSFCRCSSCPFGFVMLKDWFSSLDDTIETVSSVCDCGIWFSSSLDKLLANIATCRVISSWFCFSYGHSLDLSLCWVSCCSPEPLTLTLRSSFADCGIASCPRM